MFDYLQQFNKLPKDLRSKISEKEVMSKVSELEKKYQVDLAALIMKVMVKQIPYKNIALYLVGEKDLDEKRAEELTKKLKEEVFKDVSDYLEGKETKKLSYEDRKENIDELEKVDKKEDKREDPQELINQISKKESHNIEIDKVTKDIIDKVDVSLSSAYLHDRLHLVLRTYIKGVRDKIATRSALSRSGQEGGLSLDDASIDKLLKLADEYKKSLEPKVEEPKPKVSEEAEKRDKLEALNENYSLKDSLKSKEKAEEAKKERREEAKEEPKEEDKEKEKEDLYKKLHIKREIAPPPPSTIVNKEKEPVKSEEGEGKEDEIKEDSRDKEKEEDKKEETKEDTDNQKKAEELKEAPKDLKLQETKKTEDKTEEKIKESEEEKDKQKEDVASSDLKKTPQESKSSAPINLNQTATDSRKKSMQDIQVSQRIMGPVDELRYFNLKNFRRLSSDPQEAFEKIREKIDLLAKDSYEKRIEGIQAWKQNPLNRLYHQISIESLNQSKPISEIIEQRKENDMDYLSSEELKKLVSFNKSFMF
ncbi:MAG: hypothetical protein ACLFNO_00105 [Parcubacteria group bacterium]